MIRVDRAWSNARNGARPEMLAEVDKMTDRELELVIKATQELLRAADHRLGQIEREKIRTRITRYGHARGVTLRARSDLL